MFTDEYMDSRGKNLELIPIKSDIGDKFQTQIQCKIVARWMTHLCVIICVAAGTARLNYRSRACKVTAFIFGPVQSPICWILMVLSGLRTG